MKLNRNIVAHRGIHNNKEIPENSLAAFKQALKLNYPIELDVQLTKDNTLVVFHDYNLKRLTNKDLILQQATYDDLKKISLLNTTEKIPTLKEVLNLINSKVLLDIEIKNTKRIKETCDILLSELRNYNNYILKSFNPLIVKYLKVHYPEIETGYLITNNYKHAIYNILLTNKFTIELTNSDFLAINKELLNNQKFMKKIHNKKILVWTINNQHEITNKNYIYICNNLPYKEKTTSIK